MQINSKALSIYGGEGATEILEKTQMSDLADKRYQSSYHQCVQRTEGNHV